MVFTPGPLSYAPTKSILHTFVFVRRLTINRTSLRPRIALSFAGPSPFSPRFFPTYQETKHRDITPLEHVVFFRMQRFQLFCFDVHRFSTESSLCNPPISQIQKGDKIFPSKRSNAVWIGLTRQHFTATLFLALVCQF